MQSTAHGDFGVVLCGGLGAGCSGCAKSAHEGERRGHAVQDRRGIWWQSCRSSWRISDSAALFLAERPRALTWAMHDWLALSRALPGITAPSCASTEQCYAATLNGQTAVMHDVDVPGDRTVPAAANLLRLHSAKSALDVCSAFEALGVEMPIHANLWDAIEVLDRFVVVTTGPDASKEWCRAGAVAKETGPHQEALCWHCTPFMRAGTCEHTHAALLQRGRIPMEEAALPQRKPHAPFGGTYARRGTVRLTCGGGDTPRSRCGPNSSISAPAADGSAPAGDHRVERLLQELGLDVHAGTFASAGVEWGDLCSWWMADVVSLLGVPDVVASRLLVAAKRRERTGALPEAADGGSFTALATQHHALATVKVDNLPTAQRLTSGSVPSQQDLYAGPAPGTGHSLLAKEQRRYLVNVQTGCAHPTNDGVTMTCGHKRPKVCTLTSSIAGFELCAFARGCSQEQVQRSTQGGSGQELHPGSIRVQYDVMMIMWHECTACCMCGRKCELE